MYFFSKMYLCTAFAPPSKKSDYAKNDDRAPVCQDFLNSMPNIFRFDCTECTLV